MYRRFLNNNDYLGLITPEALAQLTRGNEEPVSYTHLTLPTT